MEGCWWCFGWGDVVGWGARVMGRCSGWLSGGASVWCYWVDGGGGGEGWTYGGGVEVGKGEHCCEWELKKMELLLCNVVKLSTREL